MDKNKLDKLNEIGYSIPGTCNNCVHGHFGENDFGVCLNFTYDHLKHSDTTRQLSVNKTGRCDSHEFSSSFIVKIGTFSDFLEKTK